METKKYEITKKTKKVDGRNLYRIIALKDFGDVKKGDLGGWIEKAENLSQKGDCWVCRYANVYNDAKVYEDAVIFGNVEIYDNAEVYGAARIFDDAQVYGNSIIYGEAKIHDNAYIHGNANIYGNAYIHGNVIIKGNVEIGGFAEVSNIGDYIEFKNHWSSGRYFTYTRSNKMWRVGCFYGTGKELIEKAYKDSEISGKMYEKYVKFAENF